jgi:hypothetical protein
VQSKIFITIAFLILVIMPLKSTAQQEIVLGEAEINAYIEQSGELPSIKVNQWSTINITILDTFGMNWSRFQDRFFNWSKPLNVWFNTLTWNILFGKKLDRPLESFLGFTTLRFTYDVLSKESNGWKVKITPNTIGNTTTGKKHFINLEVMVDKAPVDYSAIIRINCTRLDTYGVDYGYSLIDIPLKAEPTNFISMNVNKAVGYSRLHDIKKFTIDLTNKGYYKDTFFVNLTYPEELFCNVDNQILTLDSGESKTLIFNVLTPDKIIDLGTPYLIKVYVHSIGNDESKLIGSYTIITNGIYFNPLISSALVVIFSIVITSYLIHITLNRKKRNR